MLVFIGVCIGSATVFIYWFYKRYQAKQKIRNKFKKQWGKSRKRDHNWGNVRRYYGYRSSKKGKIDDATWEDLNLGAIFDKIDHTVSPTGQQVLYDIIRFPLFDASRLEKRKQFVEAFSDEDFRIELQLKLHDLKGSQVWRLPDLLFDDLPEIPTWYNFLLLIPVIAFACFILGVVNPIFFLALGILPVFNMLIQYLVGRKVKRYTLALSGVSPLLGQAEALGRIDSDYNNPLGVLGADLRSQSQKLSKLKKRVHTYLHEGNHDSLGGLFWDYLNILLLLRINMFTLSIKNISQNRETLKNLFRNVGYLDAMLSLASFRESLSQFCYPDFSDSISKLTFEKVYHPLLEEPVANSIEIEEKGILITGSNMAGKTTFLKTIGVNQIFAQTLNLCFADQASLSFCNVTSSMRREDNLQEGKSFYMGEVERVRQLIDEATNSTQNLFLLDEIFRGTNTVERVSASLEVLKWLRKKSNFVLASTHDLELIDLLSQEYKFYHFTETVSKESMSFDYKIKKGHSSTKNAIKLLALNDYPDEIVRNAMKVAEDLEQQR